MDSEEEEGTNTLRPFPSAQYRVYAASRDLAERGEMLEEMVKSQVFEKCYASAFNTALALNKELVWLIMLDQQYARLLLKHLDALWQ